MHAKGKREGGQACADNTHVTQHAIREVAQMTIPVSVERSSTFYGFMQLGHTATAGCFSSEAVLPSSTHPLLGWHFVLAPREHAHVAQS